MMMQHSVEEVNWGMSDQPTEEELRLSGGLQVEDWSHARHVMYLATQLFQATRPLHHYGKKALRLLERAAFLHNTGLTVESRRHHKHSYRLIKETPLPDFTEEERHEIACIARYHRRALPSIDHEEYAILSHSARKRVSTLSAILRVVDALDYNHDGRVLNLEADREHCNEKIWTVRLYIRSLADLDDELEHAHDKSDLFEKVFNRKLHFVTMH
jgi:exopolyphosphatase/guanosine-5'-triphosphate,3'-diphosphate pyrophosphatase